MTPNPKSSDLAIRGNVTVSFLDPRGLEAHMPDMLTCDADAGDTVLGAFAYAQRRDGDSKQQ